MMVSLNNQPVSNKPVSSQGNFTKEEELGPD